MELDIQVVGAAMDDDRTLTLKHMMHDQIPAKSSEARRVLEQVRILWGFDVVLLTEDAATGEILDGLKCTNEGVAKINTGEESEAAELCLV